MNILLFFICFVFSAIFLAFYKLSVWENILFGQQGIIKGFSSITGNLFFESLFFLIIGIFFLFYFSSFSFRNKQNKIEEEQEQKITKKKYIVRIILFLCLFGTLIWGVHFISDLSLKALQIWVLLGFLLHVVFFYIFSEKDLFRKYHYFFRFFAVISLFIAVFFVIALLYKMRDSSLVSLQGVSLLWGLLYSIWFNISLHKQFENLISLICAIISWICCIWFLLVQIL